MRTVAWIYAAGWAAFWLYWLVAAFSTKRGRVPWSRELRIRALIIIAVLALSRAGVFRHGRVSGDIWRAVPGLILLALGLGLAIWARLHIGRNWGTPMTEKEDPELVATGPYRMVRHPIYLLTARLHLDSPDFS